MQPVALNTISPDTGLNIKGVTDDLPSYSYTYTEPGTYTVTFIVAGGQLPGTVGARSLRGDVHGDRPDRITRPKVFASPPFSKKGGLFHNIRLHFCVFSSNFGGET